MLVWVAGPPAPARMAGAAAGAVAVIGLSAVSWLPLPGVFQAVTCRDDLCELG